MISKQHSGNHSPVIPHILKHGFKTKKHSIIYQFPLFMQQQAVKKQHQMVDHKPSQIPTMDWQMQTLWTYQIQYLAKPANIHCLGTKLYRLTYKSFILSLIERNFVDLWYLYLSSEVIFSYISGIQQKAIFMSMWWLMFNHIS